MEKALAADTKACVAAGLFLLLPIPKAYLHIFQESICR